MHGIAAYGSIEGDETSVSLKNVELRGNGLSGLMARDLSGGAVTLEGVRAEGNGRFGAEAFGADLRMAGRGNALGRNGKGPVGLSLGATVVDK